ncbi:lipase [Stylonychia lemnae]|uniref:Lipase n=1 Tax=Stylonychia lemnae TaxID=5949 RepID=A0A078A1K6_STYLE|nr:lipase [Stylonychia lemnae]|eukprot:CDW74664.1 lipase [Stylonychia lemnae]
MSSSQVINDDFPRGLTADFQSWLDSNGFQSYDFVRKDLVGGSFGGKQDVKDQIKNIPIVFVHGNSDVAVGTNDWQFGFTKTIQYFMQNGYSQQELYATTWGNGNYSLGEFESHDQKRVMLIRKFFEAVLAYTGQSQIQVISHSMGVTLSRRALKGGKVSNSKETYDVGPALTAQVDTFISLAGGNYGVYTCKGQSQHIICNIDDGYWPAQPYEDGPSIYLKDLNDDSTKEAQHVFALLSLQDMRMTLNDIDFGKKTGLFPTVDDYHIFTTQQFSHLCLRDFVAPLLMHLLSKHDFNFNFDLLFSSGLSCPYQTPYAFA